MPLFGFPFLGRSGGGLGEVFYKHFPSRNPFLHGLSERFGEVGRSFSKFHLFKDRISFVAKRESDSPAPSLWATSVIIYYLSSVIYYLFFLTSYISRFHLPYQIRLPSAPVCESFLSLPWARKISLVGAQIFILIDNAKVQKIEMQNKPFSSSFLIYFRC